jgi:hypothetical protein
MKRTLTNNGNEQSQISVTLIGLLAFACGATNNILFNVIGEIYAAELILVLIALILLLTRGSGGVLNARIFWGFLLMGLVTLIGYMISDLIVGTEQLQYLRGWGRVVLLISDFVALMILTVQNKQNLWWFTFGIGMGGVVFLAVSGVPIHVWKLGYAEPISLVVIALSVLFPRWLALVMIIGFGILDIFLDYRSLGALSLVVAAVMWARFARPQDAVRSFAQYSRFVIVGVIGSVVLVVSLLFTMGQHAERRESSNIGREARIIVSLHAIAQSPIIGYGSWTVNEEFARMLRQEIQEETDVSARKYQAAGKIFRSHSQLLQSWIEGGILGAAFFLFYGYTLIKTLRWCALIRPMDKYTPVFVYLLVVGLWNLVASPFGSSTRIWIALAVAVVAAVSLERQIKRRVDFTPNPGLHLSQSVMQSARTTIRRGI